MKTPAQVKSKMKDLKYSYLAKEYRTHLKVCPANCIYNYRHKTVNEEGEEVEIGLCTYGSENAETWNGDICDDVETAMACPVRRLRYTKEEIKEAFEESLLDEVVVANNYKDIAALQWVTGEKVYSWDLNWRQRFILWILYRTFLFSWAANKVGVNH